MTWNFAREGLRDSRNGGSSHCDAAREKITIGKLGEIRNRKPFIAINTLVSRYEYSQE